MNTHDCSGCGYCQKNEYCSPCIDYHKRIDVVEWFSRNKDIDSLINKCAEINDEFEWIFFKRFTDVEYLVKGGFGTICKATLNDYERWNHEENRFKLKEDGKVVLKLLHDSKQITSEFITEVN